MIVIDIALHSAIDGRTENLGTMIIDNLGTGTRTHGNYRARMFRKGAISKYGPRGLIGNAKPTRDALVMGHARLAEPVQNLVAKALTALGYK
jgi:hypothetical protein